MGTRRQKIESRFRQFDCRFGEVEKNTDRAASGSRGSEPTSGFCRNFLTPAISSLQKRGRGAGRAGAERADDAAADPDREGEQDPSRRRAGGAQRKTVLQFFSLGRAERVYFSLPEDPSFYEETRWFTPAIFDFRSTRSAKRASG